MKRIIFCFAVFVFLTAVLKPVFAQVTAASWTVQYAPAKVFIENKGQFRIRNSDEKVLYAFDNASTNILFTKNGVTYSFLKRWEKDRDEVEEKEHEEKITNIAQYKEKERKEHEMEYAFDAVDMRWENSNPDAIIVAEDMTSDYYSYCIKNRDGSKKNVNYIRAFKKLTYKNLYPNVDVEYVFHPDDGIKYTIILHPGADISKIKMNFSQKLNGDSKGNLHIMTDFGDIIDHAPVAFYADDKSTKLGVHFARNSKTVSFSIPSYDNTRTLIIDPWVQTPSLPNSNGVWECERDGAGNVYIIGGDMPMKLLKYNAAGAIQWTYNTPFDTANCWLGTFVTDLAGDSYVTSGSIAALQKINTSAGLVWNYTAPLLSVNEYWNIAFNCDQTKLIIGGTTGSVLNLMGAIFDINTSNGAINSTQIVGHGNMFGFPPTIQEVRSMTSCRNARYYFLTLDTIGCIDQNFSACSNTPTVFRINSGYNLGYKSENFRPNNGNSGLMHIRANRYNVYSQNGLVVDKRDLNTGAILTSGAIPGGIYNTVLFGGHQSGNSGIDIDSCGNVFVGSATCVVEYTSNLTQITAVATPFKVFDVAVSTGGNVIICGATGDNSSTNRTGYVQSVAMSACNPMSLYCCDANICPAGPICDTMPAFNLVAGMPGGTWSGPGITNTALGTFNPGAAGAGFHTIVYTLSCGSDSTIIQVLDCGGCPGLTVNITNLMGTCGTQNTGSFNATASGTASPFDFSLSPAGGSPVITYTNITGTQSFTGLGLGNYTLIVTDNLGCSDTLTVTITQFVITLTLTPQNEGCQGDCNGQVVSNVSGGTALYTYAWSNGQSTASVINLCAGNYSVTVTDANGCSASSTTTVGTNVAISADFVANPTSGGVPLHVDFTYTGSGATSFAWNFGDGSYSVQQNPTYVFDSLGTYMVTLIVNSGAPDFCVDSFKVVIDLNKPSKLVVPNVFTPNGDSHNDEFKMESTEIASFDCVIFNRWEKKIYEWGDVETGWDGNTNGGAPAADGVYFYIIIARGTDSVDYNLHGTVTLMR